MLKRDKVVTVVWLNEMPMDRWDYDHFVHATGRLLIFENGTQLTEYEDTMDYQDWDESEAIEYWEDDYFSNDDELEDMPCDVSGICAGMSCPNYGYCHQ